MTEAEWLATDDPHAMAEFVAATVSRKQTLFNAACCRRVLHLTSDVSYREAVEAAERVADGLDTEQGYEAATQAVLLLWRSVPPATRYPWSPNHFLSGAARHLRAPNHWAAMFAARATACRQATEHVFGNAVESDPNELTVQVRFLHDIYGNPFRPVSLNPEWRTSTAVALTQGMYESRDFSAMPILSDALQDAGCDSADILDHCRGPGPHVRGCWVVDLVLGKG